MVGEDLPQEANRVDLDPTLRDVYGFPVPRITYSSHPFELAASSHFGPRLGEICASAPGAIAAGWLPVGALAEASGGGGRPRSGPAAAGRSLGAPRVGDGTRTR